MLPNRITAAAMAALLVAPALARAQSDEDIDHPGVVSIDWSEHFGDAEPKVSVRLTPTLLRFMTSMAANAANEATDIKGLEEIISQLRQVRVAVRDVGDNLAGFGQAFDEKVGVLKSDGWETIVRVRDNEERVDVLMLPEGDRIVGVVVLALEPDELAFVNVAGDFDPESLGKHLGAIARQAKDGKIKLKELLGEAVINEIAN